ncbi:MAG: TRAP transporter substrate-binding protein [Rhodospirillaceae bacterium]
MRFFNTLTVSFSLFICGFIGLPAHAQPEATITLRVSAYLSPLSHSVANIYKPWMERITEASNGRIKFETFWGGGLGRNPYKQFDLVKAGITDIGLVQPSYTPGQFPQLQAFELPFMMRSSTEASLVAWRLYERGLLKGFEDVKLIGLWTAEPSNLYTRDPIKSYKDIARMKIRSVGRLEGDFLSKMDSVPEALHPADAVEALRRGTIDGAIQGWIAINTFQTYRATSYVITAPLGTVTFGIMMNKDKWEQVPADLQQIINDNSGDYIALLGGQAYDQKQAEISAQLRADEHLIFVDADPAELEEMQTYVKPIAETWAERTPFGAETYEAIQDILKDLRRRERQS